MSNGDDKIYILVANHGLRLAYLVNTLINFLDGSADLSIDGSNI